MRKRIFIVSLLLSSLFTISSQTITLDMCQDMARENYPIISQKGLIDKLADFNISNAKKNWLPQISFMAQVSYQSEVMALPTDLNTTLDALGLPFEGLSKDQYKAAIQIEQTIYDGGATKALVDKEKAEKEVSIQGWEVEMYGLRERVNQLYFGTLLLQEKIKEIDILIEELHRNRQQVQSYINNGVAEQNDVDRIDAEILSIAQQKTELSTSVKAYRTMLGVMINKDITPEVLLEKPDHSMVSMFNPTINRPEMRYFEAQENSLEAQRKGINALMRPQIGFFVQGAYANPGLNLFADMQENQWSPYFITGVKLLWNISSLYSRKNNLSKINTARLHVESQKETFLYNMKLKSTQENIAIERMREVMKQDDEIIRLRTSIRQRTEIQMKNGTMNINNLLKEIHAENLARQNKVTHEIELLKNMYDLLFTTNHQ